MVLLHTTFISKQMSLTMHERSLFQRFQTWAETNAKEHTLSYIMFMVRMLIFATFGLSMGYVAEKIIVKAQGPQDRQRIRCSAFLALQLVILSTIFYIFISFGRYFDDWLWSTFAGTFFALCLFNAQVRLNDNIQCLLN